MKRAVFPFLWIDVFLRDDVHILGLGLYYSEIDIWWAITYKNHLSRRSWPVVSTRYLAIDRDRSKEDKAKYALLTSLGLSVEMIDVKNNNWTEAWERVIGMLPTS